MPIAIRNFLRRDRTFVIAIAVSLIGHIACMSIVKVRLYRTPAGEVRFSSVSFLGSLPAGHGGIEVRKEPSRFPEVDAYFLKMVTERASRDALEDAVPLPEPYRSPGVIKSMDADAVAAIESGMTGVLSEPHFEID